MGMQAKAIDPYVKEKGEGPSQTHYSNLDSSEEEGKVTNQNSGTHAFQRMVWISCL